MGAQDYYFSNTTMPTLGRMWILKMLQDAEADGGGLKLLGSVVQEATEPDRSRTTSPSWGSNQTTRSS